MKVAWGMRKWSEAEMQRSLRILADQSYHTYKYPLEVLARHPETRQSIVDYAELVAAPKRVIERVYADLGLPVTPELERMLAAEEQKAKRHDTAHAYSLEEFGLRGDEIRSELADLFERYHWDEVAPRPAGAKGV